MITDVGAPIQATPSAQWLESRKSDWFKAPFKATNAAAGDDDDDEDDEDE